ncbi:unnamed protein product [Discosporangium mesarthrocarpum]
MFVPEELDSGMLVQCALDPLLAHVYEDLLRTEGWEIFMQEPALYGYGHPGGDPTSVERVSFLDISERVRARGHIAIGIERRAEQHSAIQGGGAQRRRRSGAPKHVLTLNPHKRAAFDMSPHHRVVVLARLDK